MFGRGHVTWMVLRSNPCLGLGLGALEQKRYSHQPHAHSMCMSQQARAAVVWVTGGCGVCRQAALAGGRHGAALSCWHGPALCGSPWESCVRWGGLCQDWQAGGH